MRVYAEEKKKAHKKRKKTQQINGPTNKQNKTKRSQKRSKVIYGWYSEKVV